MHGSRISLPILEQDIACLTEKAAVLTAEAETAERPAYRLHAKNELVAVNRQITDLENIIARAPARSLADAAVQLRCPQVAIENEGTGRVLRSISAVVEASQGLYS